MTYWLPTTTNTLFEKSVPLNFGVIVIVPADAPAV